MGKELSATVRLPLRLLNSLPQRSFSFVLLLFVITASYLSGAVMPVRSDRWLADVKYLSSDELKGRGDGTPELNVAADYIAEEFRKAGLQPMRGSYFQPFTSVVGSDLGAENRLARIQPDPRTYRMQQDFVPLGFSFNGEKTGGVAFVGYGITAPEYKYDDYSGIDVKGKIVIVLRHEPQENDANSVFEGKRLTRHAEFISKVINARNHGAGALIVVNDPVNHSGADDRLVPFGGASGPGNLGLPVVQVKQDVAADWLKEAGQSFESLQRAIDRDLSNHSFAFPATLQLNVRTDVQQRRSDLKNVVGLLPGSDPKLRDEVIVIGGHYDHLGLGEYGSMAPSLKGQIHHGADDNASGTAGVMELARILSAERATLRRSVLFMAFAGEELGLFGSAHYVQDPLIPLNRTVAMLNLDMIGRIREQKLYVGGVGTSPGFRGMVEKENKDFGFDLDFSDLGYDASDHMSFGRNQVPVMFFFTGLHADYHKPSDTWDKVEPAETARLLEMVAGIARQIDSADARPAYTAPPVRTRGAQNNSTGQGATSGQGANSGQGAQGGYGPYFGSVPDFGDSVKGVKFADVREGSPAAQAGLRAGDVLVSFDGQEITNLYDFTYALGAKNAGDEVPVVVLRSGQRVNAKVTLGSR